MKMLVLDTNILLHGRFFLEIDWADLVKDEVTVLIPIVVVNELDAAKQSHRTKATRRRAKQVVDHLVEIFETKSGETPEIRPRVKICIDLRTYPNQIAGEALTNDDKILRVCANSDKQNPATLVTDDAGMILKALALGIPYLRLPEKLFERSHETEHATESMRTGQPRLSLSVLADNTQLEEGGLVELLVVGEPSAVEFRERQQQQYAQSWTAEADRHSRGWLDGAQEQRRKEQLWKQIGSELESASQETQLRGRTVVFQFRLSNNGASPATHVHFELSPSETLKFLDKTTHKLSEPLMQTKSVSFSVRAEFPPGFSGGGASLEIKALCAEQPTPLLKRLSFRVNQSNTGPFADIGTKGQI